ncbi:MAG: helix-turn-helix transcriptional regulator [Bacteroides sp.]|nr:helix-turn-helix transcriptional regulator [Eubacterium sp.]MCM1419426.1 helix-turn-helix transcriptional regulator [Roseburia sp.]MCM1462987.1 helix-turn-helix transcriptional regulator [Bacteroides sp.]
MLCRGIRHQREKRKLTQTELAERVGIRQATLSEYESGSATPGVKNLIRLADALNCSLDELCEREGLSCR